MKHPTAAERQQCVSLYSEGVLLKHLVEEFGRHRVVISRWIKQADAKRGHKFRMIQRSSGYYREALRPVIRLEARI